MSGYYLWMPHGAKPDGSNVNAMHMNHCGIIVINWSATFKDFSLIVAFRLTNMD